MSVLSELDRLVKILKDKKFPLEKESYLQVKIAETLLENGIEFDREKQLDKHNRPDFLLRSSAVAIEVKINGSKPDIYKQVLRYSEFENVEAVLLITNKSIGQVPLHGNKPFRLINLSHAWM